MQAFRTFLLVQFSVLCLSVSVAGHPTHTIRDDSDRHRRTRSDDKRVKLLEKALRKRTSAELVQLARAKKESSGTKVRSYVDWSRSKEREAYISETASTQHHHHHRQRQRQQGIHENFEGESFTSTQPIVTEDYGQQPPDLQEVDCPLAEDGLQLFPCPTPDERGRYRCLDDHQLCDKHVHCPGGEDEDPTVCMFHRMTMNYFKVLMDAMFGLSRSVL